jgi:hypothetical protein
MPSKDAFPKPKRNTEDAIRDAAQKLRPLLEDQLAHRMPEWTVQSTPRGLGVDIRQGKDPIALVWWDADGWWCRRWPTPGVENVEPIHDMDDWTLDSMVKWILDNDPAKPKKPS